MASENTWIGTVYRDLAPLPGRLSSTLRIVTATVISLILLLVLQVPFASLGLYFVFLVARESPAISLRSSVFSLCAVMSAVALEMGVVILTDNDPVARLLSVAAVGFLAGLITIGSNLPPLGASYGLIFCTLIAFWENPAPADTLVKNSLWVLASFSLALGCSVAVEYALAPSNPAAALLEQIHIRYQALTDMFEAYARGATDHELAQRVARVQQLAAAGQGGMQALYNEIVERNLDTGRMPIGSRVRIAMLAQLMDDGAAFATQYASADLAQMREKCAEIAEHCRNGMMPAVSGERVEGCVRTHASATVLEHVEETICALRTMPVKVGAKEDKALVSLPAKKTSFWQPGACTNSNNVVFALRVSLCVTICYIIYHAADLPGIATAVTTVFVSANGNSGAINQRIAFRTIGAVIGGILAISATAFVFPYIDTLTPLVGVIAAVAFLSAWIAGGRQFSYVGSQIAFSFYIVAFEGFSAPTQLSPSRDRLIGILLALGVMWFVFDQLWPVRTVTAMRQVLAGLLRQQATLLRLGEGMKDHEERLRKADALRDQVGRTVAALRTMNDAVVYELGVDSQQHQHSSEMIVAAAMKTVAMFWNQLVILHREEDRDFLEDPRLMQMRERLAERLDKMSDAVSHRATFQKTSPDDIADALVVQSPRFGDYVHNSTARFEELQALVANLNGQPV